MMLSLFVVCACWSVAAGVLEVPRCCPDGANLAYNAVGADLLRDVAEAACQPVAEPAAAPWAPRIYQPAKATWMERGQIPPRWRLVGPRVPSCEPLRPLHDVAYTLLAHNGSMHVTGMTRVLPLTRYCIDETAALVCSDDLPRVVNKCCPEKQAYFEGQCVDSEYGPKAMEDLKAVASAAGLGVSVAWPTTCSHFSDVGTMAGAVPQPDGSVVLTNGRVEAGRWCAEAAAEGIVSILACTTAAQHAEPPAQHLLYGVGLAVGAAFLAATLAASFTLPPSHRALHWRCQTHYVATLFLGDVLLAATQLAGSEVPPGLCKALAVCMHFLFLAAFFWLNTMCFNIWWTFRDFRPTSLERTQEAWRLRVYQVYAWGVPLLLAGTAAVLDVLASDSVLRPRFGERSCWFYGDSEILVYFFGPVGVLLLVNVALFLSTAHQLTCGLWRRDEVKATSERAALGRVCTKLVVVMGVTWGADVLSWAIGGPNYLWYATDLLNALQGVLIFLVVGWHAHARAALRRLWMKVKRAGGEGGPEAAALDERARATHSSTQLPSCGESLTNTTTAPPPAPAPEV